MTQPRYFEASLLRAGWLKERERRVRWGIPYHVTRYRSPYTHHCHGLVKALRKEYFHDNGYQLFL
ncbi:hypothetical protein [Nibribacter koreensis]|uniref:Uncharacterized protein n=1 Tax=Nibribacter koreensis TaxID=1084519 RepID=A0ABP8FB51_9BACT